MQREMKMNRKLMNRIVTYLLATMTLLALGTLAGCTTLGEDAGRKSFEPQRR
jgi:hypothetical protein